VDRYSGTLYQKSSNKSTFFLESQFFHIRFTLNFPEYRLQVLQLQKVDGYTKECLFAAIIIAQQENFQNFCFFRLLCIISVYPELFGLCYIGSSALVGYKGIKIVNISFFLDTHYILYRE
jgi:hypothetical protein